VSRYLEIYVHYSCRCFTVKKDPEDDDLNAESLLSSRDPSTVQSGEEDAEDKRLANALDLSESEEEEEMEDLVEDFLANVQGDEVGFLGIPRLSSC
jgi:DNA-directed RNA polymerase III subunit RPC4